jgi:hypothetical protein
MLLRQESLLCDGAGLVEVLERHGDDTFGAAELSGVSAGSCGDSLGSMVSGGPCDDDECESAFSGAGRISAKTPGSSGEGREPELACSHERSALT